MQWDPRKDPGRYPRTWHSIILEPTKPSGDVEVFVLPPKRPFQSMNSLRTCFNSFKACLRAHPWHPTTHQLIKQHITTRVRKKEFGSEEELIVVKYDPEARAKQLLGSGENK